VRLLDRPKDRLLLLQLFILALLDSPKKFTLARLGGVLKHVRLEKQTLIRREERGTVVFAGVVSKNIKEY
jgi:hypothetical protein